MADEAEMQVAELIKSSGKAGGAKKKLMLWMIVAVVLIGAAAGGGLVVSRGASKPPSEPAAASQPAEEAPAPVPEKAAGGDYTYYDFEPIIVNLDEPRLARYIRATLVVVLDARNKKASDEVVELLNKKKPELKSWLTVYLAGCTLEDVRGPKNLNRIRREIQNSFNEQLWPNGRGMIERVLIKEFAVQ
jgi:flagellar protein FliL